MPTPSAVKPTLVYWHHCDPYWGGCYWPLSEGSSCPMDHDDGRNHNARKRRVWICEESEERTAYLTLAAYQEHLKEMGHDS